MGDFDFFGHQLVAHHDPAKQAFSKSAHTNKVDGKDVPVPHFGVVLSWDQWQALSARLTQAGVEFVIEPGIRFAGEVVSKPHFSCTTHQAMRSSSKRSRIRHDFLPSD